jgi:PhnB protein
MRIHPQLSFDGQCKPAFLLYQQVFGGTITSMQSYGESPIASTIHPRWYHRIMHATLQTEEFELAGADVLPDDYRKPEAAAVILAFKKTAEAERIFNALADGGEITLPFQHTFWSAGFGMLVDRFGIPWEISSAEQPAS